MYGWWYCKHISELHCEVKSSFPKFTAVLSNKLVKGSGKHLMAVSSAVSVWELN